jgi:hypothetical protein
MSVPDEPAHTLKAVAIAKDDWTTAASVVRRGSQSLYETTVRVPRAYAELGAGCYMFRPSVTAGCARPVSADRTIVPATTEAGTYPPLFYVVVGWPSRLLSPFRALYAMRVCSVLVCAALLASALLSAMRLGRGLVIAGVALAVTPMTLFLIGSINPNGLEIAAALCLWLSWLNLLEEAGPAPGRLLARLVASAILLAAARPLSPLYLTVILITVLLMAAKRGRLVELWSDYRVRVSLAALGITLAGSVAFIVANHSYGSFNGTPPPGHPGVGKLAQESLRLTGDRTRQMVGVLGWLDTPLPRWAATAWIGAVLLLVAAAVAVGTWRRRLVLVVSVAGVVATPILSEVVVGARYGHVWQGRYSLPLAVGIPMLSAWVVGEWSGFPHRGLAMVSVVAAVGAGAILVVAHLTSMTRYVVGLPHNLFAYLGGGGWTPPVEAPALLGLVLMTTIFYSGWLVRLAVRDPYVTGAADLHLQALVVTDLAMGPDLPDNAIPSTTPGRPPLARSPRQ